MIGEGRKRRGITILEITIALVVLMALIGSSSALLVQVVWGVRQVEEEAQALTAVKGMLARIRSAPVPGELPKTDSVPIPYPSLALSEAKATARWEEWEEGLVRVTVTLFWTGCRGVARRLDLTTIVEREEKK
ncbi:MAG: type IV pilus modification PilV family protein [Planctomycetota bacterium]|jgi:hypothetical protein